MTSSVFQSTIRMAALFLVFVGQSLHAQLPGIKKEPWLGYFAVHEQRDFLFKVDSKGEGLIVPLQKTGAPITQVLHLPVRIFIEEKTADGKIFERAVQAVSLSSADVATEKLTKVTFKGKTAGDAAFEVTVEAQGAKVRYGGRITDKGTLTTNPIRLCVQVRFPNAYKAGDRDKKEIVKQMKEDAIKVTRADGKRVKLSANKPLAEPPNEVADKDLTGVGVEIGAWRGMGFEFSATPHSAIRLSTESTNELLRSFFVQWSPDAAADPKGEARFQIEVK